MKKCRDCGETQVFDKFYIKRTLPNGTQHFTSYCKECCAERQRERNRQRAALKPPKPSPEELRKRRLERKRLRRQSPEGKRKAAEYRQRQKDAINEYNRRYREQHRESLVEKDSKRRAENPAAYKEYVKRWKAKNKPAIHIGVINQRAKQLQAPGRLTVDDWQEQKERQKFTCLMCKRKEPDIKLEVDHITPMIDGGTNTMDNIQGLCHSCNSKKHRQVLDLRTEVID